MNLILNVYFGCLSLLLCCLCLGIDPLTTKVEGDDINSVAGLLKLYFRELKEPLFPPEKFQPIIAKPEKCWYFNALMHLFHC